MQRSKTRRGVLTATGGVLVALAGCSNTGGQGETPTENGTDADGMEPTDTESGGMDPEDTETATEEETDTPTGADAMLRVAHLAPDAPNVDVAVDGDTVLEDVAFETVSEYLSVPAGDYQITVTPTGGDQAVFDESVTLASGPQTAAAIGEVSGESQPFSVTLLTDDDTTATAGNSRVRVVHAIPDAPAVDVTAGETVIVDDLAFGEDSEYVTVPADTGSVELRPESEDNQADPAATFSVDLTDMGAQTVFATGYLEPAGGQPGARLAVATDAEPDGMTGGTETGTPTTTPTETPTGTATATDSGGL